MTTAPEWNERDLLLGVTETLHNLMAWMVMAQVTTPERMKGIIAISAEKLEKAGSEKSALAVRTLFAGALNGEWQKMQALIDPQQSGGSA
jgi:hypothetical protein